MVSCYNERNKNIAAYQSVQGKLLYCRAVSLVVKLGRGQSRSRSPLRRRLGLGPGSYGGLDALSRYKSIILKHSDTGLRDMQ